MTGDGPREPGGPEPQPENDGDGAPAGETRGRRLARTSALAAGSLLVVASLGADLVGIGRSGFGRTQLLLLAAGALCGLVGWTLAPRAWRLRVVWMSVALTVTLVLAEIVVRSLFGAYHASIYRIDEECLLRLEPGARRFNVRLPANGGGRVEFRVNSGGFRGEEFVDPPADLRVVVYGDSFIAAEATSDENTFAEQLEDRLERATGRSVEAVNAGVVAYGPDQVLVRMREDLPALDPDLVVVSVLAENDFGDLLRNKLVRVDADGRLVRNDFTISDAVRSDISRARTLPVLFKMGSKILDALTEGDPAAAAAPDDRLSSLLETCRSEYAGYLADGRVTNLFWDHADVDLMVEPRSESALAKVRLMGAVLAEIGRTAERAGVPLVVMIVPAAGDVCEPYDLNVVDPQAYPEYRRSNLCDAFQSLVTQHGLDHVNLFEAFRAVDANELYFHGGDTHWNDAGQSLAADLVGDHVVRKGLLEGPR